MSTNGEGSRRGMSFLPAMMRSEGGLVAAASLAFGVIFSYPVLLRLTQPSEQNDWDFESQINWVPWRTVVHYFQFPLWNPWKCGGMPMLGNPQSRFYTPFFLLHLIVGPMVGAHLEITLHLAIAWAGGYVLARVLGLRPLAAAAAATIYPAAGWFPLHMGEGHLVFLSFAYLPWLIAMMFLAREWAIAPLAIAAGLLFTFSFGEGGAEAVIHLAPLLVVLALCEVVSRRSLRPVYFLALAGIFALGFSAAKLLPTIELVRERSRVPWGPAWIMWHDLPDIFFARDQVGLALKDRFFIEFGDYISPAFVALAIAAIAMFRRRVIPWLLSAWVLFLFIRGDNCVIPLYSWLRDIPYMSMLRLSSRFLIPFTLCVAMLAALGVDEAARRFGTAARWAAIALIAIGTIDSLLVGTPFLAQAFERPPHHVDSSPVFRQFADWDVFDQTVVSQANMGFVHCYEYTPWKTSVVAYNEKGYRGEQYMDGPGTVLLLEWTPNRLVYEVDTPAPSLLVINQNHEPGWRLARGAGRVISSGGLLAVAVEKGHQQVTLVYRGWPFEAGCVVSLLTLAAAILIMRRSRATAKDERASHAKGS